MQHLLVLYYFSQETWLEILGWVRSTANLPIDDIDFQSWWAATCERAVAPARKGLASLITLTTWWLWKHRNGCIFGGDQPLVTRLSSIIKDEAHLWVKAGATSTIGLGDEQPHLFALHSLPCLHVYMA